MKRVLFAFTAITAFILVGCEESKIVYDGKEQPVSQVEEILGDKLEVENPGMDLDVDIYEESEE